MSKMSRYELLEKFIKDSKYEHIAEIGVRDGETTFHLLRTCKLKRYILVDIDKRIDTPPLCEFRQMKSTDAAPTVKDGSLDLIFIDADHSFESVTSDITSWLPKVRKGGMITGHDYMNPAHRDVEKAVDSFFGKEKVEFNEDCYVWMVRV